MQSSTQVIWIGQALYCYLVWLVKRPQARSCSWYGNLFMTVRFCERAYGKTWWSNWFFFFFLIHGTQNSLKITLLPDIMLMQLYLYDDSQIGETKHYLLISCVKSSLVHILEHLKWVYTSCSIRELMNNLKRVRFIKNKQFNKCPANLFTCPITKEWSNKIFKCAKKKQFYFSFK